MTLHPTDALAILRGVVGTRSDRSDLVIPQREIPRVIHELLDALHDDVAARKEAGDRELFDVLKAGRRSESIQDQANLLRRHFLILLR